MDGNAEDDESVMFTCCSLALLIIDEGKLRAIGVSNYEVEHLEEMLKGDEYTIKPAVNQCELHPHYPNTVCLYFVTFKQINSNVSDRIQLLSRA
jgi:diketogulonate reductase-like aldo/keto reductase